MPFKYTPLNSTQESSEIRLVELWPFSQSPGGLVCNIRPVSLDNHPAYEALSYVWGSQATLYSIACGDSSFNVGENLWHALNALQLETETRVLWIDAVCINQNDNVEKSQQVQMMSQIYEQSRNTIIWLGKSTDDVEIATSLINELIDSASLMEAHGDRRKFVQMWPSDVQKYKLPTSDLHKRFAALKNLLDRPWFHRAWIIQEAALPAHAQIHCGPFTIPLDAFFGALAFAGRVGLDYVFTNMGGSSSTWVMLLGTRVRQQRQVDMPLLELLRLSKESLATDARDRVYALCGLASDADELGITATIDYSSTNSAADVFTQTAASMMNQSRTLDVLCAPRRTDASNPLHLPSWVPDWSANHHVYELHETALTAALREGPPVKTSACSFAKLDVPITYDTQTLTLSGLFIDRIERLGAVADFWESTSGLEKAKRDTERLVEWMEITGAGSSAHYPTGESRLDAFWQTFYGGHYGASYDRARSIFYQHYGMMKRSMFWTWAGVAKYASLYGALVNADAMLGYVTGATAEVHHHNALMGIQRQRCMGVSAKGFFLLAPSNAKPRDCVFVLKGGNVPFLLRRSTQMNGTAWEMVGEVYVHGIMKGEAWVEDQCEPVKVV